MNHNVQLQTEQGNTELLTMLLPAKGYTRLAAPHREVQATNGVRDGLNH